MSKRAAILSVCILAAGVQNVQGQMTTVINDDFESGLSAWSAGAAQAWPIDLNGTPILFAANDPLLHQLDGVTHDSQSAGFASNLDPWDNSLAVWLEKRFVGVVPAGTVHVHLELDRYVYKDPEYRAPAAPDPYAVSARLFLLTDGSYDSPCFNFDGSMPASATRSSYNAGASINDPSSNSGKWSHLIIDKDMTTTTGNFELRLLMHEKYKGAEAVAWDNVNLTIGGFTFTEDFESGLGGWTVRSFEANHAHDDAPRTFTAADPRLFANAGNPGSASAGFSALLPCYDDTRAAWLYQLFPQLYPPGTYAVSIEADVYVYKNTAMLADDPQALGNRVFVLTDEAYNDPAFAYATTDPIPGLVFNLWRGDNDGALNGIWQHLSLYQDVTTATGNFEVRLLMQYNISVVDPGTTLPEVRLWANSPGEQAVAWDNVVVNIGPPCHRPRFDADGDNDVDQSDFAFFQTCYTGPAATAIPGFRRCRCMNADGDTSIDQDDFLAFKACLSGSRVLADPHCEDTLSPP